MPIYVGVGNTVKSATPVVGAGGAVHTVMSGKCGVGGAIKSFYNVSNNIDHVELRLTSLKLERLTSGTYKTIATTKAGLSGYATITIDNNNNNSHLSVTLYAGAMRLWLYGSHYVVLKNGQKINLNSFYSVNGLAIYYPVYVMAETESGTNRDYEVNLFGTNKTKAWGLLEFNMGSSDGTGNTFTLYNSQYSSSYDMSFDTIYGKKNSGISAADSMTIGGTIYHVTVVDALA